MLEVRVEEEVIGHAIVDAINTFVREVLEPRCPPLEEIRGGPGAAELDRLKYEVAARFAAKWTVSLVAPRSEQDAAPGTSPAKASE